MVKERRATPRASSQDWDRRSVSRSRTLQSDTPVPQAEESVSLPKLTLKLRFFNSAVVKPDPDLAVSHPRPRTTLQPPVVALNGRPIHKPQHAYDGNELEHDHMMDIDGDQGSPALNALPTQSALSGNGIFKPIQDVYPILHILHHTDKIQLYLPSLCHTANPNNIQPYSARMLTHLYITCYERRLWNLCDMIADTWIRAFHARRKKSQTAPEHQLWRRNKALNERKRKAYEVWRSEGRFVPSEFDQEPRYYGLEVSDPKLAPDVTNMHIDLLNTLYAHTSLDCGARMLWADALALAGDHTQKSIDAAQKRGLQLHHELLLDVLQTTLRVAGRNLTLKIEESTEGAWCKRYHEHAKHRLPCYREVAVKNKEEESDWQIQVGEEEYHAFMQQASKEKAQYTVLFEGRKPASKHVSFGDNTVTDADSVME